MDDPHPINIDGCASHGKTYILYPIIRVLQKANEIVLVSASSTYAAKNYPGGCTSHFLYGIPVDEHSPFLTLMVCPRSDRAKLLLVARCHIIDEISMPCTSRHLIALTGLCMPLQAAIVSGVVIC